MSRHQVIAKELGTMKKITITSISASNRIPVAINFNTAASTYGESMAKLRRLTYLKQAGFIKQLIPTWYNDTMNTIRNQQPVTSEDL